MIDKFWKLTRDGQFRSLRESLEEQEHSHEPVGHVVFHSEYTLPHTC